MLVPHGTNMILVVVGLPGSGKSTIAEFLRKKGYDVIELGDIWRELLKKAGIPRSDPRATREFTKRLREEQGKDIYAKYAVAKIKNSAEKVVIMGVRSTYELDYIKKHLKNIVIIGVQSPFETRFNRLRTRGKPEDPRNIADFRWLNTREKRGFLPDKEEEKHGPIEIMKKSGYTLRNTKTTEYLEKQLDQVLKSINSKRH